MGKIISIIGVIAAILTIITFFIDAPSIVAKISSSLCSAQCNELNKENETLRQQIYDLTTPSIAKAKEKCELLAKTGYFEFHQKSQYFFSSDKFTEKYHLRAIATDGNWSDLVCSQVITDGKPGYILEGIDTSEHKIERISSGENGKVFLEHIATIEAKYKTKLSITAEKTFGERDIFSELGMIPTYRKPGLSDEDFYDLVCRYDDYRIVKHFNFSDPDYEDIRKYEGDRKSYPCIVAEGKDKSKVLLAFACTNYTRTMIQGNKPKIENVENFKNRVKNHRYELFNITHNNSDLKKLCQRSMGNHPHAENSEIEFKQNY